MADRDAAIGRAMLPSSFTDSWAGAVSDGAPEVPTANWSAPAQLTGTSLPTNVSDSCCLNLGTGSFELWYFNGGSNYVEVMTGTSLTGGYTVTRSGNWAGWGHNLEAPSLFPMGGNIWGIMLDGAVNPTPTGMHFSQSVDGRNTWSSPQSVTAPNGFVPQHGSVILAPAGFS